MEWIELSFDRPLFLLGLMLLPVIWLIGRRSLSSLGRSRYWLAMAGRSALLILLVLALAEIQLVRISERIVAYFLVDHSVSVDRDQRDAALHYVNAAVGRHGDPALGDAAGVIAFGSEAQIEHPPAEAAQLVAEGGEAVDPTRTNLAAALKLAKASFPSGVSRRVVVLSDGNQNLGDALTEARNLADDGIGIDVAPLAQRPRADVVVDKVTTPAAVRAGVPFDVKVVLENYAPPELRQPRDLAGRLTLTRKADGVAQLVADERVTLPPGKTVLSFRQDQPDAAFYTYEARFVPDDPAADKFAENNHSTSFTHVRGRGRVLLIVNSESPTEYDSLVAALRKQEIEVSVQSTETLFGSLADLQNFDTVVLANVPRTSGESAEKLVTFSDEQIEMLVHNVEQLGAGLVMLGGPDSFGAGGWSNTKLEKAMPVDFQVSNSKVAAVGALMLVIDKSGSMDGIKLEMSRAAAREAVRMLGPSDYIGIMAFDSAADELIRLQKVGARPQRLHGMIERLASGGGTNMEPGMRRGYAALEKVSASVKHMIVLTDGRTEGSGYAKLAASMRAKGITTTTVAVGADADRVLLQDIAARGSGKFYQAINPKALPRIFTRETRRVVRPLVFEDAGGIALQANDQHEILQGIDAGPPPITGYVLTTLKENPLVEVMLAASKPAQPNNTVLATWTFGMGRTVAFTTDAGQRWARQWPAWGDHEKLLVQMIRWSMRPIDERGSFHLATAHKDGKLVVSVQALSEEGEFLSGLPMAGSIVRDNGGEALPLEFEQTGPGRYQVEIDLADAGSYFLAIRPGDGHALIRSGVTVPYSPEYRTQAANEALLLTMANLQPKGGTRGEIIRLPENPATWPRFAGPNIFRRDLAPGRLPTGVWPLVLLIAAGLFLLDVFNRRVSIPWQAIPAALARRRRPPAEQIDAITRLDRLKTTKRLAATRWQGERDVELAVSLATTETAAVVDPAPAATPQPALPITTTDGDAEETYSGRLLKAKRAARQERDQAS